VMSFFVLSLCTTVRMFLAPNYIEEMSQTLILLFCFVFILWFFCFFLHINCSVQLVKWPA